MGFWKIWVPTGGTNMVLNPSAEVASPANYGALSGATVTRDTIYARFGDWSYKIVPGGTSRGISLTMQALGNAIHWVTFYVKGTITGTILVSLNGGADNPQAAIIGGSTGGWVRYGAQCTDGQSNGSVSLRISNSANETWYVDAIQVEQSTTYTTYIDGDRRFYTTGGWPAPGLYGWNGHHHASTSFRDAQERGGGREMDLETDFGIRILQVPGAGMPPVQHNLQGLALQPGAAFQSTKTLPRMLTLIAEVHAANTTGTAAANFAALHSLRKDLIDLFKPDAVRGAQPFVLGYSGANSGKTVYCMFRYADGLGIGRIDGGGTYVENQIPITLLAVDPYWWEDNRETSSLGMVNTLTGVNRVMGRVDGVWQKLGTGFNSDCYCSAYDPTTGRVYFGGGFATANGVTVNGICYWNPVTATFTAMDGGVNLSVYAIAIAPNGDVWIGGGFTTVGTGAAAAVGLAKWSLSGSSWSVPTSTATSFIAVYALVIDANGNLYGGGSFLNYSGNANCDGIFKYTSAGAFAALGTGITGGGSPAVWALAVWIDGTTIYVGGNFTTGNGVTLNHAGYWNSTTFVAIGGGLNAATIRAIAVARNGNVYYGGNFTASVSPAIAMSYIGMWNGKGWAPLSNGVAGGGGVYALYFGPDGLLYISGEYTAIGPFTTAWPAVWNGSNFQLLDMDSTGAAPIFWTFLVLPNGDLYEGDNTASTRIVGSPTTGIVSTNSVAVFPNFTLIGPTSTNMQLQAIQNYSADLTMRFSLTINIGERLTISLAPGKKMMISDWRGVLSGQPIPPSDFANFIFQPTRADGAATNTIITFVTGTTTGAKFLMHWIPGHWSIDGVAA